MSFNTIKAAREAARLWSWKDPVRISIPASGVTFAGEQTLDGVALVNGDALLVEDGVEGGIRIVQAGAWARREDARFLGCLRHGTSVRVLEGTNAGIVYQLDTTGDIEPGVTSMTWSQEAGGGGGGSGDITSVVAGAGMTGGAVSGAATLNVATADATIVVNADSIQAGVMQTANLADASVTLAKQANLAAGTTIGRAIGAGTGVPQALTTAQQGALALAALATAAGDIAVNSQQITGMADGVDPQDAVTVSQMETAIAAGGSGVTAGDGIDITAGVVKILFAEATTTPTIKQTARTSDAAVNDLLIKAQDAFDPAAPTTNSTGANLKLVPGLGGGNGLGDGSSGSVRVFVGELSGAEDTSTGPKGIGFYADEACTATWLGKVTGTSSAGTETLIIEGEDILSLTAPTTSVVGTTTATVSAPTTNVATGSGNALVMGNSTGATTMTGSTVAITSAGVASIDAGADAKLSLGCTTNTGDVDIGRLYTADLTTSQLLGTYCTVKCYGTCTIWSTNGGMQIIAGVGDITCYVSTYMGLNAGVYRRYAPASVTPGSSAATTLMTITVPASGGGSFKGLFSARDGTSAFETYEINFDWNADGSTATLSSTSSPTLAANRGTVTLGLALNPTDFTTSVAGLVITLRIANASGWRCILGGNLVMNS
jgi:hypothetical protein